MVNDEPAASAKHDAKKDWIVIRGDGVAANCCARLLGAAGVHVCYEETTRSRLPAILLGEGTQALIRDVFAQEDWLRGLPRIVRRVVAWGPNSKPVTLPHSAVVISERLLSELFRPKLSSECRPTSSVPAWTIIASRPLPAPSTEYHFGSRKATALALEVRSGSEGACWIESLANGWLFLISTGGRSGWLLSVGGSPEDLLVESRVIMDHIDGDSVRASARAGVEFPAYPRIASPLCGPGWLSCGTAALAFDPLCGDGTGHAIREAILAAAIIRAAAQGADTRDVLAHYQARLLTGFKRHLQICRDFYRTGGAGPWWETETDLVLEGIEWCAGQLGRGGTFRYRLDGFELKRL